MSRGEGENKQTGAASIPIANSSPPFSYDLGGHTKEVVAKKIADILRTEFSFPADVADGHKARWIRDLCDIIPERKDLGFQILEGRAALKSTAGQELADNREIDHLFCIAHHDYVLTSGTDVDHAVSFAEMKKRQTDFIRLLNTDAELADHFLQQPNMVDFFRRDSDGVIKGTQYFYRLCYNDQENLWLLCHACNISKLDSDSLKWFAGQPSFGRSFLAAITAGGEVHPGLIVDLIYQPNAQEDIEIKLNDRQIKLHTGHSVGLGEFIRRWFLGKHHEAYELHKQYFTENYHEVKQHLEQLYGFIANDQHEQFVQYAKSIKRSMVASQVVYTGMMTEEVDKSVSSRSDHSSDEEERKLGSKSAAMGINQAVSEFKYIRSLLEKWGWYTPDEVVYLCHVFERRSIDAKGSQAICDQLKAKWQEVIESDGSPISVADFEITLRSLSEKYKKLGSEESYQLREQEEAANARADQAEAREQAANIRADQAEAREEALQFKLMTLQKEMKGLGLAERDMTSVTAASRAGVFASTAAGSEVLGSKVDRTEGQPKRSRPFSAANNSS